MPSSKALSSSKVVVIGRVDSADFMRFLLNQALSDL